MTNSLHPFVFSDSIGDLSVDLLLSEEVDAAIEGLGSYSSQQNGDRVSRRGAVNGEEFVKEELINWDLIISTSEFVVTQL